VESDWVSSVLSHYNWLASLVALGGIIVLTKLGKFLAFRIKPLEEMRQINIEQDDQKWSKPKYPPIVNASNKVGLWANIVFFLFLLPFAVTLESTPVWKSLLDIVAVLMFYDFFYYLSHRFWFHGNGAMRKIHAVHHQARTPTNLDAYYVHPLETFIGIALYMGAVMVLAPLLGSFHVITIILSYVLFTQINIINHTHVALNYFPFKTLTWITKKHHIHHENMHKGNYATITPIYDKIFGTLD
jgi:sterol desaturase/sphingolipid hydroxylase (fatty acid hydroxylase superfamily)